MLPELNFYVSQEAVANGTAIGIGALIALASRNLTIQAYAAILTFGWFVTILGGGQFAPYWLELVLSGFFLVAFLALHIRTPDDGWLTGPLWCEVPVFLGFFFVFLGVVPEFVHSFTIELVYSAIDIPALYIVGVLKCSEHYLPNEMEALRTRMAETLDRWL